MRLVMMGTGPFAVPTFRALIESRRHEVLALVTQPPRATGRRKDPPNPMRQTAEAAGLAIFDPERINRIRVRAPIIALEPEILVVADYGQILNTNTLAMAPRGAINLHGGLLPKYRGAAPINWALFHGETETGVTVIQMTPELDAGPILMQTKVPIDPVENAEDLEKRLAEFGVQTVLDALDGLEAGTISPQPQDQSQASLAPRLEKSQGAINWSLPAQNIRNQIRAFVPWPKSFTFWQRDSQEPLRVIVNRATVVAQDQASSPPTPGVVIQALGDELVIACGQDALQLNEVQPAGKRLLQTSEFLRGYPVQPGDLFQSSF